MCRLDLKKFGAANVVKRRYLISFKKVQYSWFKEGVLPCSVNRSIVLNLNVLVPTICLQPVAGFDSSKQDEPLSAPRLDI